MADTEEAWRESAREYHEERKQKKTKKRSTSNANGPGPSVTAKPVLVIDPGELPQVAEKLRDILAASGALFDRGTPVRIAHPADGLPIAIALTTHGVVRAAHQFCRPIKNGDNATLPDRVAGLYLDMIGEWKLPRLVGVSTAPLMSDDGGIHVATEYDHKSGLYCCNVPGLTIPEHPTAGQAKAALRTLRLAFKTFPFGDAKRIFDHDLGVDIVDLDKPIGHDETGFLNGLLTAVCRQSLHLAPGLLLNAPQISGAGNGKGLLAHAISIVAYGINPRPFTMGNDRHEMDKRLVADVMEGSPVLFMDNVNTTLLRSNTLASLLTERPSGVRELGKSRMIKLEHASFFVLTGNGLTVSEDLARRFIFCELDAQCEDPEQRPFKPGFPEEIKKRRAELLTAALTIWRWGRQKKDLKSGVTLGSFERWGEWVRDPLLALGCRDPVERIKEIKARDPARQQVIQLFEAWWEHHGPAPIKANDLAEAVKEIADPQGRGRQFLARTIANLTGTRQAGYVLTQSKGLGTRAIATYALKKSASRPNRQGHAGHADHARPAAETSTESEDYPDGPTLHDPCMTPCMTPVSPRHADGMQAEVVSENQAISITSDGGDCMTRMTRMTPPVPAKERCDYCGHPADHQALQTIADDWRQARLHRRCEGPWFDSAQERRR
jgi:hypothetical protein